MSNTASSFIAPATTTLSTVARIERFLRIMLAHELACSRVRHDRRKLADAAVILGV